jgi:tRNA 2-thiouridine synthesizing protein A
LSAERSHSAGTAMSDVTIDTRGLACPLPVLKVRKAMRGYDPGTNVVVLATDPGAEEDLRAYCEASGSEFLSAGATGGVYRIVIRKR